MDFVSYISLYIKMNKDVIRKVVTVIIIIIAIYILYYLFKKMFTKYETVSLNLGNFGFTDTPKSTLTMISDFM